MHELLDALRDIYASSENISRFVDVHLVIDPFDRQFNTWRNVARLFARTDYVMMLDIDFYLCTDFRSAIRKNPEIMRKLHEGQSAFVIPAFEYADYADGTDHTKFPGDKEVRTSMLCYGLWLNVIGVGYSRSGRPRQDVSCSMGARTQQYRLSEILYCPSRDHLQGNSISASLRAVRHFQKGGPSLVGFAFYCHLV